MADSANAFIVVSLFVTKVILQIVAHSNCLFTGQFPEHGFYGLVDKILLFKHDMSSANLLNVITSEDDVSEGCLIEVILSG